MKQFNNITTLIFDFGGVLINLDLNRCIQKFKDLGVNNFENNLNNYGQKGIFLEFEKGLIDIPTFRDEIRKLAKKPLKDNEIDEAWCAFLCNIPNYKIELLLQLKKKFRLLLLSNTNPLHIEISAMDEFARFGQTMQSLFDKCYFSYEMKMVKPDAEIFEALLANAGVTAEECLFLDDGEKNILQAEKMGIQTYHVDVNEDLSFLAKEEIWLNA
jgi:putative hydrolase of the HAD superfamily